MRSTCPRAANLVNYVEVDGHYYSNEGSGDGIATDPESRQREHDQILNDAKRQCSAAGSCDAQLASLWSFAKDIAGWNDLKDCYWNKNHGCAWFASGFIGVGKLRKLEKAIRAAQDAERVARVVAAGQGTIAPATVRFSQNSVRASFSDDRSIGELVNGLRSGAVTAADVPPIRLVERDGLLFTLDNRRLVAFQKAGVDVRYRIVSTSSTGKFTTRNGGTSIEIRGTGEIWSP